ncbi:MAG: SWF/SNF family helicase, partial [Sciscionella sp.]
EYPCQHAAALCYQAAWLLDDDPFVLLLVRGRDKRELLEELSRHGTSTPAEQQAEQPRGTPAEQAYAATVAPLPPAQPVPTGMPVTERLPGAPGVDPNALAFLVEDTAARARELLAATEPPPVLDEWQDTVRIAATRRLSCADRELARAVRAWEYGGRAGLEIHDTAWRPSKTELANAHAALERMRMEEDGLPELTRWRNRWTAPESGWQLRYGTDGRWYPYRADDGAWWPAGPPERDPVAAFGAVLDSSSGP